MMKCLECGAPTEPGMVRCDFCGHMLEVPKPAPGATAGSMGVAPGGTVPVGLARQWRALSSDGSWYNCFFISEKSDGILIRWHDGREATLPVEMVRKPCDPAHLQPGARVFGEYEGRYYPGTVKAASNEQWTVQFDDGESAIMPSDRLYACGKVPGPVPPGQQVLAQAADGLWYPGRIVTGPDQSGFQRVRLDAGGEVMASRLQINGPAGAELLQVGRRVMGIGEDNSFYPATVKQAVQGQAYLVFDDGEEAWLFTHQVRFIC